MKRRSSRPDNRNAEPSVEEAEEKIVERLLFEQIKPLDEVELETDEEPWES